MWQQASIGAYISSRPKCAFRFVIAGQLISTATAAPLVALATLLSPPTLDGALTLPPMELAPAVTTVEPKGVCHVEWCVSCWGGMGYQG
jgi:hypothetical protein